MFGNNNLLKRKRSVVDPYASSVTLYLKGDESPLADTSPSPKTLTIVGNTTRNNTQSKYGGYSIRFDGSGDYITTPYTSANFCWWDADFTAEAWIYSIAFNANPSNRGCLIGNFQSTGGTEYWSFGLNNAGIPVFYMYNGTTNVYKGTTNCLLNTWNHVAVTRTGTTLRTFVNGTQTFSVNATTGIDSNGIPLTIGQNNNVCLNAYVDALRFTKGVARYTANFNPNTDTYMS